jgi:hypothetical protein
MPLSKGTVNVRIGVAVDETGKWCSIGWAMMPEDEIYQAADGADTGAVRYFWLEAELPLPTVKTIAVQNVTDAVVPD